MLIEQVHYTCHQRNFIWPGLHFTTFLSVIFAPLTRNLSSAGQRARPSLSLIFLGQPTFLDELVVPSEVRVLDKMTYSWYRGLWNMTNLHNFLEWKSCVFFEKAGFYSLFGRYFSPRHHDLNYPLFPWPLSTFMLSNTAHVSMKFNKFEFTCTPCVFNHCFPASPKKPVYKPQNSSKVLILIQSINKAEEKKIY